jgi:DtxR family transcriptional regulator, Mn-dependent transcriptional regulator
MHTERFEEYLETILYLIRKNQGPAKTKQISEELNVSPPSVTEMIKKLNSSGLVEYTPYQGVELTEKELIRLSGLKGNTRCLKHSWLMSLTSIGRKLTKKPANLNMPYLMPYLKGSTNFWEVPNIAPTGTLSISIKIISDEKKNSSPLMKWKKEVQAKLLG